MNEIKPKIEALKMESTLLMGDRQDCEHILEQIKRIAEMLPSIIDKLQQARDFYRHHETKINEEILYISEINRKN